MGSWSGEVPGFEFWRCSLSPQMRFAPRVRFAVELLRCSGQTEWGFALMSCAAAAMPWNSNSLTALPEQPGSDRSAAAPAFGFEPLTCLHLRAEQAESKAASQRPPYWFPDPNCRCALRARSTPRCCRC